MYRQAAGSWSCPIKAKQKSERPYDGAFDNQILRATGALSHFVTPACLTLLTVLTFQDHLHTDDRIHSAWNEPAAAVLNVYIVV